MQRSGKASARGRRLMAAALVLLAAAKVQAQESGGPSVPPAKKEASRAERCAVAQPCARKIVISIPDRKLALLENGRVVKVYAIAVGAPDSPSPTGEFKIVNRLTHPTYYKPGVVIPAGENNPLGTRWMGLNAKSFGIHGTNEPWSVGHNASHGCIRMRNRDAEELFELMRVGDTVELAGERNVELAAIFGAPAVAAPAAQPAATAPVVVATAIAP